MTVRRTTTMLVALGSFGLLGMGVAQASDGPASSSVTTGAATSDGAVATTVVASATTATAPVTATTVPNIGAPRWHFEGSQSGVEHFTLGGNGCAQLSHRLESTMRPTAGGAWKLREVYCGTINEAGLWTGDGTFTIATRNGQLRGTKHHSAQIPSSGVPYVLTVTGGTGTYAGAHGSCVLSGKLRPGDFGTQYQEGTFSCDLDR